MKTQVGSATNRQGTLGWRRVSVMLPGAIALLLAGCPAATTSASQSETDSASSTSASPQSTANLTGSEKTSASTGGNRQAADSPAAATKSSADEKEAVRQAVLDNPSLNASIRREFERLPDRSPQDIVPLQVGAIAIVENYALAEAFGGVGDLPVIDGYYLLKKQNERWILVDSAGGFGGEIATDRLANLGLLDTTIQDLLDALRAIGADFTVTDSAETSTIPREQVVLGGISPDLTLAEVQQRLGEPLSKKVEETGCCGVLVYLEYPTLSLGLYEEGGVFSMKTTHLEAPTGAGVRIADPHEAVTNAYGPPSRSDGGVLIYYVDGSDQSESLSFALENGHVSEISYSALLN